MISFQGASEYEHNLIRDLAHRAVHLARKHRIRYDWQMAAMDLTAVHLNAMPLDFDRLATFDDFNFAHDVLGIRRHLNRETGELGGCFVPRCAR